MAVLSTTAWVLHELGLAAGFGSNLFGQLALNPAIAAIDSKRERGKVTHVAWDRYKSVNGASLLMMAGSWLAERSLTRRGRGGPANRALTVTKDVLVGAAVLGGAAGLVLGKLLDREVQASNEPIRIGSRPSAETRRRVEALQRFTKGLGTFNVMVNGAVLATSALLAVHSTREQRWTLLSRLAS